MDKSYDFEKMNRNKTSLFSCCGDELHIWLAMQNHYLKKAPNYIESVNSLARLDLNKILSWKSYIEISYPVAKVLFSEHDQYNWW